MKFQYYRIFLDPITQLSLLPFEAKLSKKDILEKVFYRREPLYFNNGGQRLAYKTHLKVGDYIYGSVARHSQLTLNHSPEEDFKKESVDNWPVCRVLINISDDPITGQSIAFESDLAVFRTPLVQLRQLARELRKPLYSFGYEMNINPITEQQDFWNIIAASQGRIKDITFTFDAPNLFGTGDKLNDELRDARDSFLMTKATIKLENPDAQLQIPKDSEFVKQGVQYVTDGGGEYKIRVRGRKTYSSSDSVRTGSFDDFEIELSTDDEVRLEALCDRVFSWLKSSE